MATYFSDMVECSPRLLAIIIISVFLPGAIGCVSGDYVDSLTEL